MFHIFSFIILLLGFLHIESCPTECVCYNFAEQVDCSNRDLSHVPSNLPDSIAYLDLSYNKIIEINETDFAQNYNLRNIDLSHNDIVIVAPNSFQSQHILESINLAHNRLQTLSNDVFPNNDMLKTLDLSNNLLTYIDNDYFSELGHLETLNLENNSISCIENKAFASSYKLRNLYLRGNKLVNFDSSHLSRMIYLEKVSLADNNFLCECNLAWFPEWRLSHSNVVFDSFKCAKPATLKDKSILGLVEEDLNCFESRANPDLCPKTSVCPDECECRDGIVECQRRGLTELPKNLPYSAKEIKLLENMIKYIPAAAFKHIKNLNRIDLSSNSITEIHERAFEGAYELTQLCLYSNSIKELPENLFRGLTKLKILLLNTNEISCLPEKIFQDLPDYSLLSLYRNNIQSFANGTIRPNPTGVLHLGDNPFICDCNLKWIKTKTNEPRSISLIEKDSTGATCDWPLRLKGRKIKTVQPEEFACEGGESARTKDAGKCFVDLKCPLNCNCSHRTKVDCSNAGFRSIPMDIPRYTTELILDNNLIEKVEAGGLFKNMVNLRTISLKNNLISDIEDGAFLGASELNSIELCNNSLHEIRRQMFRDLPNLRRISLRHNKIKCLKNDTFLDNKNLEFLSLFANEIRTIEENPFVRLPLLKTLNFYSNPLICNCHLGWLNEWVNDRPGQMVTGNPTCVEPKHLQNLPIFDLTALDFNCLSNKENSCVSSLKCPKNCKCVKTTINCHDKQLIEIPKDMPVEVTELILSKNAIRKINLESLKGLKELKVLDLSSNMISTIPNNTFQTLIKLESLNLVDNYIKCIGEKAFHGLVSVKYLSLTTNMISQIPESSFQDLNSLTHLYLGNNKLYCDCDIRWLARLIQDKNVDGGVAKCEEPERMAGQALLFSDVSNYRCEPGEPPLEVVAKCNPCLFEPCRNDGKCLIDEEIEFKCACPREFGGRYCENALSECYAEPCQNGGMCHPGESNSYWCECTVGYSGKHCEVNIDDCKNHKCKNNATCVDGVNEFFCKCSLGFTGDFCEVDVDLCDFQHNQCQNGALCTDLVNDYSCTCQAGFEGKNCEINTDECLNHKCQNGATCIDEINGYTCACANGFKGKFCEIEKLIYPQNSQCERNECKNDALCYEDPKSIGYKCKCAPGYHGERCQYLRTISFDKQDSYLLSNDFKMSGLINISFSITPHEKDGILFYHNPDLRQKHLLIQLHNWNVRVSYFLGTTQGVEIETTNHSVRPNFENNIKIIVQNNKLFVYVENELAGSGNVTGLSSTDSVKLQDGQPTYIGGLDPVLQRSAAKMWHIVPSTVNSFFGCIHELRINHREVNFANFVSRSDVSAGCEFQQNGFQADSNGFYDNPCDYHYCKNGASCEAIGHVHYRCICPENYGGPMCSEKLECNVEKTSRFTIDNCESAKAIRHVVCPKHCGLGKCCEPVKEKMVHSRFECKNGTKTDQQTVTVVRKCQCGPC